MQHEFHTKLKGEKSSASQAFCKKENTYIFHTCILNNSDNKLFNKRNNCNKYYISFRTNSLNCEV